MPDPRPDDLTAPSDACRNWPRTYGKEAVEDLERRGFTCGVAIRNPDNTTDDVRLYYHEDGRHVYAIAPTVPDGSVAWFTPQEVDDALRHKEHRNAPAGFGSIALNKSGGSVTNDTPDPTRSRK